MVLYIKYMVSLRCKMIIKEELTKLKLSYTLIDNGKVEIREAITTIQREQLKKSLLKSGMQLLNDADSMLIEKIKNVLKDMIYNSNEIDEKHYADHLSDKLNCDYHYLSSLFSEIKGLSIEHYIAMHKIERVKELLLYEDLNLTQICNKLHYKNVENLSYQFKKITGLTPSFYRQVKQKRMNVRHQYETIPKPPTPR
ncbi:MAG: helix-turn-helix domain-containing protein [Bacteroidia bacterium]